MMSANCSRALLAGSWVTGSPDCTFCTIRTKRTHAASFAQGGDNLPGANGAPTIVSLQTRSVSGRRAALAVRVLRTAAVHLVDAHQDLLIEGEGRPAVTLASLVLAEPALAEQSWRKGVYGIYQ